ncbi:MAG: PhzF family phenazine biosynthesis protein [Candidatus Aminicenantes bacterium]|jgi:PhzF family phenazine biosynthesis protein
MKIKVYTLNSFAKTKNGGNPAGVVLEADNLTEDHMNKVANKVGFSETAFMQKSDKAHFKVRFFTPNEEVDLCGHATIAAFFLLKDKGLVQSGKYRLETKAGILDIDVRDNRTVFMAQVLAQFFEKITGEEIIKCLNISEDQILPNLPIQIVSTGLRDILVPVKNLKVLLSLKPDFNKISSVSKKYNVVGLHVFSLETKFKSTAHCRNFAPLYGIPEESATGTSNGALSCYLFKHNKVIKDQISHLVFEQGYSMKKPSEILANLKIEDSKILEVHVGGTAIIKKDMEIFI